MKRFGLYQWIVEIVAALFVLLFVYTGISKLTERLRFQVVLSKSPLIGDAASFVSWFIPIIELFVVLLLLLPVTRKWGMLFSLLLMILFTGYIAYMLLFSPELPCSCGGVIRYMTWEQHLSFNISLTLLSLAAVILQRKNQRFIAINRISRTPV